MDAKENGLRCPITDLYTEQCAHCRGLQTLEEEQEEIDRGIITLSERLGRDN